jgi:hypothetical protein
MPDFQLFLKMDLLAAIIDSVVIPNVGIRGNGYDVTNIPRNTNSSDARYRHWSLLNLLNS